MVLCVGLETELAEIAEKETIFSPCTWCNLNASHDLGPIDEQSSVCCAHTGHLFSVDPFFTANANNAIGDPLAIGKIHDRRIQSGMKNRMKKKMERINLVVFNIILRLLLILRVIREMVNKIFLRFHSAFAVFFLCCCCVSFVFFHRTQRLAPILLLLLLSLFLTLRSQRRVAVFCAIQVEPQVWSSWSYVPICVQRFQFQWHNENCRKKKYIRDEWTKKYIHEKIWHFCITTHNIL